MKVLELTGVGLDTLTIVERPLPSLGARDLLLRIRAATLNYKDLAIALGKYGDYARPLVLGSDAVGDVVEVGANVTRFAKGDRVCPCDTPDWISGGPDEQRIARRLGGPNSGVFSEHFAVSEDAVVSAPEHLSDEEAASLAGAGVTAWQALFDIANVKPGDSILLQGTGGVSVFALQLANVVGARTFVTSRNLEKLERARELGATHGICTADTPEWDRELLRMTGGRGVDVVVDVVGGASLSRSISATRVGGTVVVLGFLESTKATIDLPNAIRRAITIRTSSGRSRASFEAFARAVSANGMRPVVDRTYDLEQFRDAFEFLASGKQLGKIALRMSR